MPVRHHHRHVSDHAWHPPHAVQRQAAVVREAVPHSPPRGRLLLHEQFQDRLPVFCTEGDVGCLQRPGALEKPPCRSAVFRGVQLRRLPRERHCRGVQVPVGHGELKAVATAGSRHAQVAAVLPRHAGGAGGLEAQLRANHCDGCVGRRASARARGIRRVG